MTLAELGAAAGGMAYPAVGHSVCRIEKRRLVDAKLARVLVRMERHFVENDSAEKV